MSGRGRPLRFLALVTVGWVGVRTVLLWPESGSLSEAIEKAVPFAARSADARVGIADDRRGELEVRRSRAPVGPARLPHRPGSPTVDSYAVQMALFGLVQYGAAAPPAPAQPAPAPLAFLPGIATPDRLPPLPDRWSASAWLVVRGGSGIGAAPGGGQLGGGQSGVRFAYLLVPERRLSAFARATTPLAGKGREAALGIEWQPTRAPVRLVAEQRFALDGGRGGTGLGLVAGADTRVAAGFRLEAYGQAGAVLRNRAEPYADGAARITHRLAGGGGMQLSLGAGAWGAAQRDAERLDLGPASSLSLPVGGSRVRVALDWRQRVAGRARPGSGLVLTLGGDF